MFWASKRRVEELERKLAERGPDLAEVERLRDELDRVEKKLREVEEDPVVSLVRQVEEKIPKGLGGVPKWILVLMVTGTFGSVATFGLFWWQTTVIRDQSVLMREQLEQQQTLHGEQMTKQQAQLDQQEVQHKEQMNRQAGLIEKQDDMLRQQREDFEKQREETRAQMALTEQQIEKQDADTRMVRRAQLLNTIYELSDCDLEEEQRKHAEKVEAAKKLADEPAQLWRMVERRHELIVLSAQDFGQCPPKAALRLREEALLALYELDGQNLGLRKADLYRAHLVGANLIGARLNEAELGGANLSGADLSGANLTGADLRGANLRKAYLIETNLTGANLTGANLEEAILIEAKLEDANLNLSKLIRASFTEANLKAKFSGANLSQANFVEADLREAILIEAWIHEANFSEADLEDAGLFEANLWKTNFTGANLAGTHFEKGNLSDANLTEVRNLIQEQLLSACGDSETRIPDALERPGHWLDRPRNIQDDNSSGCPPETN